MPTKTWFITGINRGLGRALAEALLEKGHRVAGTARKLDETANLKAKFGECLWTAALDLTDAGAILRVVDRAFADLGRAAGGDPVKMAKLMIGTVDQSPAPKRVAMGSDIYDALLTTYRERAALLEGQKSLACSTDF